MFFFFFTPLQFIVSGDSYSKKKRKWTELILINNSTSR